MISEFPVFAGKIEHAHTVYTRPSFSQREGPGDDAKTSPDRLNAESAEESHNFHLNRMRWGSVGGEKETQLVVSNRGSSSISGESLRLPVANRERTNIGFVSNSGELLRLQNSCEERLEQNTHFCHHDLLHHLSVNHTTFLNFYALLLLLHVI